MSVHAAGHGLAYRLLAAGIPVLVCTPCPGFGSPGRCSWKGHDRGHVELHQPKGWATVTAAECDLSGFRPGLDTLALVSGHGVDVVDVDTKAGGSVSHLPGFKSYGRNRTPSEGEHYLVPSSGVGKVSPFDTVVGHVGDYLGGRADGSGRMLGYLPGSTRPKYSGAGYVEEVEWDVDACLAGDPDPALLAALEAAGATASSPEDYTDDGPLRAVEEGIHPRAQEAVAHALGRLDALPEVWSAGDHWDDTHFRVGCVLRRYANSNWTGYTLDRAEADFHTHARTDAVWGGAEVDEKWRSAGNSVRGTGVPRPSTPEEVFAEPWVDPAEVAKSEAKFARDVEQEARRLRVREAARELLARGHLEDAPAVAPVGLRSFLAEPDEAARYRVDGLLPTNGRVVFSAQFKAGKTTLMGNLTRCLADGDRFLDKFDVERAQRVVLLDNELSPNTIRLWLREQEIVHMEAVAVLSLRGRLSGFNLLDPVVRSEWARAIGPADVMVFDCLRPALDVLGLSEDKEAGRFLVALDELCAEAGIKELVVVHHMGHTKERTRGDSRILDWPDAVWKLVLEAPDRPESARFFAAHGRDVSHPESRLAFSEFGRRLSIVGGSRSDAKANRAETDVLHFVVANPGCTQSAIEHGVAGDTNATRQAARSLAADGLLRVELKGQARHHFPVDVA